MIKVSFSKKFVEGDVSGVIQNSALHFKDESTAQVFLDHCERHKQVPYTPTIGVAHVYENVSVEYVPNVYVDLD